MSTAQISSGGLLADLAALLALLGSKQLVSVVELQDVVGDPDVDVAASGCLAEADLLAVHAHDTDRGGAARDPIAVAAAAVGACGPVRAGAKLGHRRGLLPPEPLSWGGNVQCLVRPAAVVVADPLVELGLRRLQ